MGGSAKRRDHAGAGRRANRGFIVNQPETSVPNDSPAAPASVTPELADRSPPAGILFAYGLPAAVVAALLGLLIVVQSGAEANVASAAAALPIGFAMAAGIVASVNPCGFFMLPTYVAYQLGTEETGFDRISAGRRTLRALAVGGTATAGFAAVFLAVGLIVAAGAGWIGRAFPFAGLGVGVLMLVFGMYLLISHRYVGILAASRVTVTPKRNIRNAFVFGVGYAIGSLACTLPIFLAVVGTALAAGGFFASFGQFASYALGMGIVIVAVSVGSALFRDAVSKWLRGALPHVHRAGALFLVGAGGYLIYYWVVFAGLV